jgi:hypothetical protein
MGLAAVCTMNVTRRADALMADEYRDGLLAA